MTALVARGLGRGFGRYLPWRTLLLVGLVSVLWLGLAGSLLGRDGLLVKGSRDMGFVLSAIEISGLERTNQSAVLAQLDLEIGMPIVSINLDHLATRVEGLPWVGAAHVTRKLPGTLEILVMERQPFALWQREGRVALIDREGVVITHEGLDAYSELPLVVGVGAADAARDLIHVLDRAPLLAARVKSAVRVGQRRWDVLMDNGMRIKLPEVPRPDAGNDWDGSAAWARLARMQAEHNILEREVEVIDMRDPERLTFRLTKRGQRGLSSVRYET